APAGPAAGPGSEPARSVARPCPLHHGCPAPPAHPPTMVRSLVPNGPVLPAPPPHRALLGCHDALRVDPAENNQVKGVRRAKDYVLGGRVKVAAVGECHGYAGL